MAALADAPRASDGDDEDDAGLSLTKLDHALNAALLLAHVASQRGDRVALLAYVDDVRAFVPPQRGRRALLAMVGALYNLRAEPIEPDHGRAFDFLGQRNLRRSLVVLFTDLADRESSASLAAHVMRVARQHLVVCVTLGDPTVRRPAQRRPQDAVSLYEKMVAQQLLDERAAVLARLAAHGVLTVDTDADKLNPKLIGTYLELTCIVIAGSAGLMLGHALLRPGLQLRREALARAARRAVELVVGTAPVLVIAGLIEGFISPSELPIVAKLAIGPLAGVALYSLLLTVGRARSPH